MGSISVASLPWVPVVLDGKSTRMSLRDVLARAHEVKDLDETLLPVEREAMLRFLESTAAMCLRGVDLDEVAEDRTLPEAAVDKFFAEYEDLFFLDDKDRPFMQEWNFARDEASLAETTKDLRYLHMHVPGTTTSKWGLRPEPRDPHDVANLTVLLIAKWFHGKPGNSTYKTGFRITRESGIGAPISGAPSGGPRDTTFHRIGRSLAETLLLNIPTSWMSESNGPAWLDQDVIPSPRELAVSGSLWRSTWTVNRPIVMWDGSKPMTYGIGATNRTIPLAQRDLDGSKQGIEELKLAVKRVGDNDYCRIFVPAEQAKNDEPVQIKAPFHLRSTEGFKSWYSKGANDALRTWNERPRVLDSTPGALLAFYNEEGDTYGNRKMSEWVVIDPRPLMLNVSAAATAKAVFDYITVCSSKVNTWLTMASRGRRPDDSTIKHSGAAAVRTAFQGDLDPTVITMMSDLANGRTVDTLKLCSEVRDVAVSRFAVATQTYMAGTGVAQVASARGGYDNAIGIELGKLINAAKRAEELRNKESK